MTTPDPIAAVAAKLSEAQRAWLLAAEPTLERTRKEPCAEWWDGPSLYVEVDGQDHWIGSKEMRSPEGSPTFTEGWQSLTPLCLEVRTILERQSHD